jgi:tetratricopeptide (TPR) repeat protein
LFACGGAEERKQRHLQKANSLYENSHYRMALKEYQSASYIKPSDKAVHYQLAQTYEKLGDFSAAITSYRSILTFYPQDQRSHARLGELYLRQGDSMHALEQAEALLEQDASSAEGLLIRSQVRSLDGLMQASLKDAQNALKSDPRKHSVRIQLASLYLYQQRSKLAKQVLKEGLEQDSKDARLLVQLARVYFMQNLRSHAESLLQLALQSDADNLQYRALQSRLFAGPVPAGSRLSDTGLPPGLTTYDEFFPTQIRLEQILEKTPSAIRPLSLLTRLLIRKGEYAQAEIFIQKALKAEPDNTVARNLLAETLIKQKHYAKAVVHLDQVIRTQSDWWLPYRNKALAVAQRGDIPQAIETYRQGIKFSRMTEVLRLDLALLYEHNKQVAEAVEVYEKMLRDNQQASQATNNLAMLLIDKERVPKGLPKALQLINNLIDEDPPAYLDTIGWVKLQSGDTDAAVLTLKEAVKRAPDIATIRYHLGKAHYQAGDLAKAQQQLQEAIRLSNSFDRREDALALLQTIKSNVSSVANQH